MMKQVTGDAVTVRFFMPSPELAPYFTTYYLTEVKVPDTDEVEDWLHPEWANIRFAQSSNMRAAVGAAAQTLKQQAAQLAETVSVFRLGLEATEASSNAYASTQRRPGVPGRAASAAPRLPGA